MPPRPLMWLTYAPAISTTGARIPACGPVIAPVTPITYASCAAAVPIRSAAAAAPAIAPRFISASSWSLLQYRAGLSCQQLLFAAIVHGLDEVPEPLVHLLALHLARRRDRLAFLLRIERLRQDAERLDLLDARELRIGALDLRSQKPLDLRMARQAGEAAVGNVAAARPVGHGVEIDLDQRRKILSRMAEDGRLGDERARAQDVLDI